MEEKKPYIIQGPDDNRIYGRLVTTGSNKLVVHLHGMTNHIGGLLEVTSAEYFAGHGHDHYRLGFYDLPQDSRKISNSTLTTHRRDIQAVLDHFKKDYAEIYITAHSLSGLVTLIHNPENVKAISFWDPSTDVTHFWSTGPYLKHMDERGEYRLDYGNIFVISDAMAEEIKLYPNDVCMNLARKITTPSQFIIPQESIALASPHINMEEYKTAFAGPFDFTRIDKANHTFSYIGNREKLFDATRRFFEAQP